MTKQTRDGSELVDCPFCGESDFDLHGLKWHLQNDACQVWREILVGPRIF